MPTGLRWIRIVGPVIAAAAIGGAAVYIWKRFKRYRALAEVPDECVTAEPRSAGERLQEFAVSARHIPQLRSAAASTTEDRVSKLYLSLHAVAAEVRSAARHLMRAWKLLCTYCARARPESIDKILVGLVFAADILLIFFELTGALDFGARFRSGERALIVVVGALLFPGCLLVLRGGAYLRAIRATVAIAVSILRWAWILAFRQRLLGPILGLTVIFLPT